MCIHSHDSLQSSGRLEQEYLRVCGCMYIPFDLSSAHFFNHRYLASLIKILGHLFIIFFTYAQSYFCNIAEALYELHYCSTWATCRPIMMKYDLKRRSSGAFNRAFAERKYLNPRFAPKCGLKYVALVDHGSSTYALSNTLTYFSSAPSQCTFPCVDVFGDTLPHNKLPESALDFPL